MQADVPVVAGVALGALAIERGVMSPEDRVHQADERSDLHWNRPSIIVPGHSGFVMYARGAE
jgi:hypothetical protein